MTHRIKHLSLLLTVGIIGWHLLPVKAATAPKPLRALLIAGGCCHDYAKQHEILSKGIQSRANVQVDVIWTDDKSTNPPLPVYDSPDWAKGYDIIIHDECAAGSKDVEVVKRILEAHKTIPAVHLHCAMHSFRTGTDMWFKHLGLQSASHGPQEPIALSFVDKEHPITKPFSDWTTIKEELYNNINVFDAHPLVMGKQIVKNKDGTTREENSIVAWTNEKQGARSFSTTIGHNNDTVADARYLDLVTRGLLWACDKLTPEYLTPFTGENKVTFVKAKPVEAPKPAAAATPPPAPKDATLVTVTASSEESGKNNFTWKAVDGTIDTRWCANSPDKPQWLQLEFEKPQSLTACSIVWESKGNLYQHKVESSADGKAWTTIADATQETKGGDSNHTFDAKNVRFLKITCTNTPHGGWASIREVTVKGEGIKALAAKMSPAQETAAKKAAQADADPYKNQGNITPRIVKLTPEQEAAILKDVTVAEGFEATVFAAPPAANYPVFVSASAGGDLYVSSDGNGSLGRNPGRGRILRLRDKDGDGRADEVKEFVKDLDAPRGLVWDHDRLYVVHPPDLSVFIDKDGDGVAEERKTIVKGIAFGYDQRPADHTTNGLSLGIDGWLYIAGGDFGFMDAVGTDGRHLQHRGGGVIRVRPDGTGLEIYSTGTRNILEVAISPTMEIFARDNTNDGGGWNVRFHHFTGLDDHGYPRLYKNFNDEAIQPLADYGGGSGCGAVYIDEPGFGEWNNAPFTCDWGTNALWHHSVKPKGAAFEETEAPKPFIKMTRPTDADVDAMSRVYCASWKGATFNWEGPDVGYIVCVKPKGFKAEPLPDFAKASNDELVKLLESSSNRRRMEAQSVLAKRIAESKQPVAGLTELALSTERSLVARIASLYLLPESFGTVALFNPKGRDEVIWPHALRVMTRDGSYNEGFSGALGIALRGDPARKRAALFALLYGSDSVKQTYLNETMPSSVLKAPAGDAQLEHMVVRLLGTTLQYKFCFAALDAPDIDPQQQKNIVGMSKLDAADRDRMLREITMLPAERKLALRALAMMHQPEVVAGVISRLGTVADTEIRRGLLATLCRLHFQEGEWKGDSWGTRPDTRGPYYQPEAWSETPKIAAALKDALSKASPDEAAFLVSELNRNRIQFNEALDRILTLAAKDAKLIPDAVGQLASAESIPAAGIPLLIQAAQNPDASAAMLSQAITALAKTDSADGCRASLTALVTLSKAQGSGKEQEAGRTAFLESPKLENHHQLLEQEAEKLGTPTALWADMALLNLSARKTGSPESRELSGKALDAGWENPQRRVQILKAVAQLKHIPYASKVLIALDDTDKAVAAAAKNAANAMKLSKQKDETPLVSSMKAEDAIAAVLKTKGDVALGEMLFTKQTCVACHTVREDQAQKGPYLGNIAQTYKRAELAQNILDPNKTIAQGFATNLITLKDGTSQLGFVTFESAEKVTIRTITAQEFTYATADIAKRDKPPISMMPPGLVLNLTVREFSSLLDYLESLVKK